MENEGTIEIGRHFLPLEVRRDSFNEAERTVEVVWSTGAAVKRYSWQDGYFMEELSMDPAHIRMQRLNQGAAFLDTHDSYSMEYRIGAVVPGSAKIENGKGICTVKFSRAPNAERVFQDVKDGIPLPISVGYRVHKYEKTEGEKGQMPVMRALDWEPMEVSAVPIPADPGAKARSQPNDSFQAVVITNRAAASAEPKETSMTPEEIAEQARKDEDARKATEAAAEQARKEAETRAEAEAKAKADEEARARTNPPVPDVDAIRAQAVTDERKRVQTINDLGNRSGATPKAIKAAIDGNVTVEQFRQQLLDDMLARSSRDPIMPFSEQVIGGQDERTTRRSAVIDALMHRSDPRANKLEGPAREWRGYSLIEIARELLREEGIQVRGMSPDEVAKRSFMSTSDFPIILEGVTNRTLLAAYQAFPQTFKPFCKQATARDFKDMHRVQLGAAGSLLKVNESGEYKRSSLGEGKEKYRIATYGRVVAVTRQTLINDDLGAFTDLPNAFGQAVSNLESDIVWGIITGNTAMSSDNVALFHANHKNLVTSGAALSADSIADTRLLMGKQKDTDGKTTLNLRPAFLLLPQALEYKGEQLMGSFQPTTAATVTPESMRKLSIIVEPRLDDASATAHYLVASPAQRAAIEFAYLEGQEGPYTESRMGFDVDGVEFKVRLDFGAAPLDWRPIAKNPGA